MQLQCDLRLSCRSAVAMACCQILRARQGVDHRQDFTSNDSKRSSTRDVSLAT